MNVLQPLIVRAAEHYGLSPKAVLANRRQTSIVRARWAVAWAAQHATEYSYPRIGRALGGRDHTTVMHGVRRAEEIRARDSAFRALTDELASMADINPGEGTH